MTRFVGEGAGAVVAARTDVARVVVGEDDAIVAGVLHVRHGARVEAVAGRTRRIFDNPNIQVRRPRPIDQVLHIAIPDVRQLRLDAVDSGVAIALGIALGELEFDEGIGGEVGEFVDDLRCIAVEEAKVAVDDLHRAVDLLIGDVLRAVVVDDVKHHRDGDELLAVARGA